MLILLCLQKINYNNNKLETVILESRVKVQTLLGFIQSVINSLIWRIIFIFQCAFVDAVFIVNSMKVKVVLSKSVFH